MKIQKARLKNVEKRITPHLHNGGVIVHPPELSQDGHAELYRRYPESKGYLHVEIQLISGDSDSATDSA